MSVHIVDHPLAQHYLSMLRDKATLPDKFRRASKHLTTFLVIEATRSIEVKMQAIETPLEPMESGYLGQPLAAVPILRAGLTMLEPVLELYPDVAVGYVGLERDEKTAQASSYYSKLPSLDGRYTLCLDPMLATGGSAVQAIDLIKESGANNVVMVSVVAAPQGVDRLQSAHPDVPIFIAGMDRDLNDKKYILPGLGDFGDRLYGTM